jgi:CheY-like chemotaxis protein
MTLTSDSGTDARSSAAAAPVWRVRDELELALQQLRAIESFHDARRVQEKAQSGVRRSREMRMDATRTVEVLRREHAAIAARADEQLRQTGSLLRSTAERRVVLAHRHEWFLDKVAHALEEQGVRVVARLDNGADTIGVVLAEQPDLVLVEETLPMVTGEEVVRETRRFSPESLVTVQVGYGDRVGQLLDAGASSVFTRKIPPGDIALSLLRLLAL